MTGRATVACGDLVTINGRRFTVTDTGPESIVLDHRISIGECALAALDPIIEPARALPDEVGAIVAGEDVTAILTRRGEWLVLADGLAVNSPRPEHRVPDGAWCGIDETRSLLGPDWERIDLPEASG